MLNPATTAQWAWDNAATISANAAIAAVFIGVIIAGIKRGLKELRGFKEEPDSRPKIAAATLLETVTLNEWSASNAELRRALILLHEAIDDHRHHIRDNTTELRDIRRSLDALHIPRT